VLLTEAPPTGTAVLTGTALLLVVVVLTALAVGRATVSFEVVVLTLEIDVVAGLGFKPPRPPRIEDPIPIARNARTNGRVEEGGSD